MEFAISIYIDVTYEDVRISQELRFYRRVIFQIVGLNKY